MTQLTRWLSLSQIFACDAKVLQYLCFPFCALQAQNGKQEMGKYRSAEGKMLTA
jgi:hypothetical protein